MYIRLGFCINKNYCLIFVFTLIALITFIRAIFLVAFILVFVGTFIVLVLTFVRHNSLLLRLLNPGISRDFESIESFLNFR